MDTQLLLLLAVSVEATTKTEGLRIAAATLSGLALLHFISKAWLEQNWLETRLLRAAGLGLVTAVHETEGLGVFENISATAALAWFLLPPTSSN